ncbi:MAG: hypothetical protein A2X64_10570 [Ignavibacteria bacterium GWF2_33_9]|nr:MAG: hypothetical protein A2X64_10570 [Ignavibacteria bacterium GWF2_33_9]
MGTLTNIRKMSPYLLAIFAIVFIGFMVLSDADVTNLIKQDQTLQKAVIGEVNGEKILYKDYEEKVRTQMEQEKSQMQDPNAEVDETRIRQQVWSQMVDNIIINQEAEKLGIKITAEEVRDEMIDNPPDYLKRSFTDSSGNFMRDVYLELVTKPENYVKYLGDPSKISQEEKDAAVNRLRLDLRQVEEYVIKNKLFSRLQKTISNSSSFISPSFAVEKYRLDNMTADLKAIVFRAGTVKPASIKVSDAEIKNYYESHKQYYTQDAQVKLKYLNFKIQPSKEDSARSVRSINDISMSLASAQDEMSKDSIFDLKLSEYGGTTSEFTPVNQIDQNAFAFIKDFTNGQIAGPINAQEGVSFYRLDERRQSETPTVKASHILIKFNDNQDSAFAVAQSLLARAKSGSDFAELAREYSEDKGSGTQGGDVGYFGKGQMVQPFEEACFAAKIGDIVGPVESQFGYHIIKLTDKINDEIKYSSIVITPNISNVTKNTLYREAYSIQKQVEGGESFDKVAERLGQKVLESPFFTNERPIFNSWYLTNQAFEMEIGTMIEPIEIKFYGVMVVQIADKKSAGIASLEDKKEEIKEILLKKKQIDYLKKQAQEIYNKVKNIGDLEQAKSLLPNLEIISVPDFKGNGSLPGYPKDIVLNQQILSSKGKGLLTPIRGEQGYYIIQLNNIVVPQSKEIQEKLSEFATNLSMQTSQNAFNIWYTKVKKDAKIEDFRAKYFKEF